MCALARSFLKSIQIIAVSRVLVKVKFVGIVKALNF